MTRRYDVFFGFSQIAVREEIPSEQRMFENLIRQVRLADALGFRCAWVGGAHLSLEEQHRSGHQAVLPFFEGEVCLNTDILQLANLLMQETQQIQIGSALHSILVNGGPIAQAEAVRTFLTLQSFGSTKDRILRLGFGSGRFSFVHDAYGISPRNEVERIAWPALKGLVLRNTAEIFVRLLKGEALSSCDVAEPVLRRENFRSDADWDAVIRAYGETRDAIEIPNFFRFERLRLVPKETPLDNLRLYFGTTDLEALAVVNRHLPCRAFHLSSTSPHAIEHTHQKMQTIYHPDGGPWQRAYLPRTVMVFVDATPGLNSEGRFEKAKRQAMEAMRAWQRAMDGTVDDEKLSQSMNNAVYGAPEQVAAEINKRFHPEDTLMLWFDFNNHDSEEVERNMSAFHSHVMPLLDENIPS